MISSQNQTSAFFNGHQQAPYLILSLKLLVSHGGPRIDIPEAATNSLPPWARVTVFGLAVNFISDTAIVTERAASDHRSGRRQSEEDSTEGREERAGPLFQLATPGTIAVNCASLIMDQDPPRGNACNRGRSSRVSSQRLLPSATAPPRVVQ